LEQRLKIDAEAAYMQVMKTIVAATALALVLAAPASAQDSDGDIGEGFDMFSEGFGMMLEGLMDEMRPMLEEARPFFEEEMLPFFERLSLLVEDLGAYELPERLPNGDIIIRRSPDAPPLDDLPDPQDGNEVEL